MVYPTTVGLAQDTLMTKISSEYWKSKEQINTGDIIWRLKNAEDNIQRLEFVLDKALQEIEKLQKTPQGHLTE